MLAESSNSDTVDEAARRRFEAAWREGHPEPIERFLPAETSGCYLATLEELVHIDLEFAWKSWQQSGADTLPLHSPPLVESYLARFPGLNQPGIVRRLLEQERLVRVRHGDRPSPSEYCARFPELVATRAQVGGWRQPAAGEATELPIIPGYEIHGILGRGGMGVVYKARQVRLNRLVALKMILASVHAGPEELARFRAEAEAVARFQHPNVVQIHEVGEHDGRPYLALEFVDGGSLAQHLAGIPQPARQAAALVETLARAMHSVHQRGIVHRDLKPGNVLLSSPPPPGPPPPLRGEGGGRTVFSPPPLVGEGPGVGGLTPKITDFGLAKWLEGGAGQTQSGAILGTPSYMAPEQAAGKTREVGIPADVYALGAMLYEMLTGRPPFRGETTGDTLLQVLAEEPVPPRRLQPKVLRDLETICLKCLHKEPRKRYASADDLAEDLRRFLADEPIRARPVGPLERALKWARRRPAAAALLAVGVLVLLSLGIGGLAYSAWLREEVQREQQRTLESEQLRAETQQQRDRAETNFQAARAAVDQMLTRLATRALVNVPHTEHVRRQALEDALAFYLKFLKQKGSDPSVRREAARAWRRVGDIRLTLGLPAQALKDYAQAIRLQEELTDAFPTVADYRQDLADSQANRGTLLAETGHAKEAEEDYRRALRLRDQLAADFPTRPVYRQELAACHLSLGTLLSDVNQVGGAEKHLREALTLLDKLVAHFPAETAYRVELGRTCSNLGLLLRGLGRFPEARPLFDRAIKLKDRLARAFPGVPDFRFDLANSYNNLGLLLKAANKPKEAEAAFLKALKRQYTLAVNYSSVPDFRSAFADTLHNMGELLLERGDLPAARQHLDTAVSHQRAALRANPRNIRYREHLCNHCLVLADTLVRLKKPAEAAAAAELSVSCAASGQDYKDAAGIFEHCVALVKKDTALSSLKRQELTQKYASRAGDLLREAAKHKP